MVSAIAEAESNVVLERAQATGQRIRGEDGVGNAVKLIESYVVEFGRKISPKNWSDFLRFKSLITIDKVGKMHIIINRQYKVNDFVSQTDH
jgi:hypothetical protein